MKTELIYQPLSQDHSEALLSVWGDREVIRFTNVKEPCTLEEIEERVEILRQFDVFAVLLEDRVIGIIGCPCVDPEKKAFGIFYQFSRESWGQGFAAKSAKWLVGYMKETYGMPTLQADVVSDNIASEKILQNLGFERLPQDGSFQRDGKEYAVHNYVLK